MLQKTYHRAALHAVFVFLAAALVLAADFAEAKRLGGGRSFGSKPGYSSGYSKPVQPARDQDTAQRQTDAKQQEALGRNQAGQGAGAPPAAAPGSRFGGIGGMFGGLLVGGLVGSLLFGGGMGAGFGGPGLLDILLLLGLGWMALRFLRSRRVAHETAGASGQGARFQAEENSGWTPGLHAAGGQTSQAGPAVPEGMDEAEFLAGAKAMFTRLQASWDKRDMADIARFTSPEVRAEITRQAAADPSPSVTEILLLEARLLEMKRQGDETVASVFYDALLREEQGETMPKQVREVWHFSRDESAEMPEWRLEGLQQLES